MRLTRRKRSECGKGKGGKGGPMDNRENGRGKRDGVAHLIGDRLDFGRGEEDAELGGVEVADADAPAG